MARSVVLRPRSHRVARFGLVGISGLGVNQLSLAFFAELLGVHYLVGAIAATQVSSSWNFAGIELWAFNDRRRIGRPIARYLSFMVVNNATLVARLPLLWLLTDVGGLHYLWSNAVTLAIMFLVRFGNITVTHLRDWYDTWYAPNNAVLVIVGDISADDAFRQAEQYFGPLKSRHVQPVSVPRIPDNPGLRELTITVPVRVPSLAMTWNVPSLMTANTTSNDAWALSVLAGVLNGGMSARFERELVRNRKVASAASAGYNALNRGDGLFQVHAVPGNGHSLDALQKAVREIVEALREKPPTEDELARVKAQVVAELIYQQDSLSGQAQLIGALAAAGYDWRLKDSWADNIMKVTANDVRRVARTWLVNNRLTVAQIMPTQNDGKE